MKTMINRQFFDRAIPNLINVYHLPATAVGFVAIWFWQGGIINR